jgi:hypothetical protein
MPQRMRPSGQHEKRSLECIFGIMLVAQDSEAARKNHGAVPTNERRESGLCRAVIRGANVGEELVVG